MSIGSNFVTRQIMFSQRRGCTPATHASNEYIHGISQKLHTNAYCRSRACSVHDFLRGFLVREGNRILQHVAHLPATRATCLTSPARHQSD